MNYRKNKGITLISLVVTIIVLIILAGISLSFALGDNGIISKAKQAKEDIKLAQNKEQTYLNTLYEQIRSDNVNASGENSDLGIIPNIENFTVVSNAHGATDGTMHKNVETMSYTITQKDYETYKCYLLFINNAGAYNISYDGFETPNVGTEIFIKTETIHNGTPHLITRTGLYLIPSLNVNETISFQICGVYIYSIIGIK